MKIVIRAQFVFFCDKMWSYTDINKSVPYSNIGVFGVNVGIFA